MGSQPTALISTIKGKTGADDPAADPYEQVVDIPAYSSGFGPQLGRLPDELKYMIFKIVVTNLFNDNSKFHECIDPKLFSILNRYASINKIRNVSHEFTGFFMEALYENYHFAFKTDTACLSNFNEHGGTFPPPVPRPDLRHHLRSMRIELVLDNSYNVPSSLKCLCARLNCACPRRRSITTFNQLMVFSPSAWFLLHLTHPEVGFISLRFLEINIITNFKLPLNEEFLDVLQNANFAWNAGEVKLTVTNNRGFVMAPQKEVMKRILGRE